MKFYRGLCDTYSPVTFDEIEMETTSKAKMNGFGSVRLHLVFNLGAVTFHLNDFLHVLLLGYSLLSVSELDNRGIMTTFGDGKSTITKMGFSYHVDNRTVHYIPHFY